jgi:copper chaperone NosL
MRCRALAFALLLPLALAGCGEKQAAKTPAPHRMTAEVIGHYCGMNVLEHPGPKDR